MLTIFGSRANAKMARVSYLIGNAAFPYNVILGLQSFNALEVALSTLYLTMKYPLGEGQVGVLKRD